MNKLYLLSYCPFCQKVQQFLSENPKESVQVFFVDQDGTKEEVAEKAGNSQFPVIEKEDGTFMFESDDIINYLSAL